MGLFGFGKSKSKTSSTSTSNSNSWGTSAYDRTTAPVIPDWISNSAQSLDSTLRRLGGADPQSYVAGPHDLEIGAANGVANLGGDRSVYDQLLTRPAPVVQGQSLLSGLDRYISPYRNQVVDAAMADFDADAGRTRATQALQMAGAGAFGGSGAALTQSLTEGELSRARNSQVSELLDQMFNRGAALSNQDADRRQAASQANAQLYQDDSQRRAQLMFDQDAMTRAGLQLKGELGAQLRGVEQQQRQAPLELAGWQREQFSGLPLQLFPGERSTGNETQNQAENRTGTENSTTKSSNFNFSFGG
jgi:hypothetical protein